MFRILKKIFLIPAHEKRFLFQAFVWLHLIKIWLLLVPFKHIAKHLGAHQVEASPDCPQGGRQTVQDIQLALARNAHYLPWIRKCLIQSVAAKVMLKRRNLPSTLYLGLEKKSGEITDLGAHAWVKCCGIIVTGWQGKKNCTVISMFGDKTA